jgi:hypothetical protein
LKSFSCQTPAHKFLLPDAFILEEFLSSFLPFFQGYASAFKYRVLKSLKTSAMGYPQLSERDFRPFNPKKLKTGLCYNNCLNLQQVGLSVFKTLNKSSSSSDKDYRFKDAITESLNHASQ